MIYFDNAATTPHIYKQSVEFFANPSSPHLLGIESNRMLSAAIDKFSKMLNCRSDEIYFTSGGTESNNLAIIGTLKTFSRKGGAVLTTPYEHPSVYEPLKNIKDIGKFDVIEAPLCEWEKYLNEDLIFASCSHVNHETGEINDIEYAARILKSKHQKVIFHVDGAQGFCKETFSLANIDLYSFSSHKFHGPLGVGGLLIKRGIRLLPLLYGGGQQNFLRPGTVNVPGIIQTIDSAEQMLNNINEHQKHISKIKRIISSIADEIPKTYVNSFGGKMSPYILNMSFNSVKGETLVHMLSERGVYASMGAACHTGKKGPTPLEKMGYGKERAASAVRFSFSFLNTEEEAVTAKKIIVECVAKLRDIIER